MKLSETKSKWRARGVLTVVSFVETWAATSTVNFLLSIGCTHLKITKLIITLHRNIYEFTKKYLILPQHVHDLCGKHILDKYRSFTCLQLNGEEYS